MSINEEEEEQLLRSVVRENARSIFLARQRAEEELLRAKEALEVRGAELARSLSMMQATLESTADGILVTDGAGRVTGFNDKYVEMWGIPRDQMKRGVHLELLETIAGRMPDPAEFLAGVEEIVAGSPPESFDRLELADGRVFERFTRIQKVAEETIGRVWSYRDITERARSEAALRAAKAEAEAASRAKSAFLATMSHELRTPLNAIAGYVELLELGIHGPLTDQQRQSLLRIQASQRHLLGLIDEVLIHARLETGAVIYNLTRVAVRDALVSAEALVAPQAWAKGIALAVPVSTRAVRADPEKLQQILANLLSNAVKFTEPGGRVEVTCTDEGDPAVLAVQDTGIGIPADKLDVIFEPFVQVRSELTRTAGGSGLGLAISRALARGMGGDLTVESRPGIGSTFTLSLPDASRADPAARQSGDE